MYVSRVMYRVSNYLCSVNKNVKKKNKKNKKQNGFCRYIFTNKVTLWVASYSACVVYTKTIIHLSVGESGEYLPPLRRIIVNYYCITLKSLWENERLQIWDKMARVQSFKQVDIWPALFGWNFYLILLFVTPFSAVTCTRRMMYLAMIWSINAISSF